MKNYDRVLEVLNATCDFLSTYEGKSYEGSIIPVKLEFNDNLLERGLVVVYEKDKKKLARAEIEEKFEDNDIAGLLTPSKNYIQLACIKDKTITTNITFDGECVITDCIGPAGVIDPKYSVINDMFEDWYITKEQLGKHLKYDDIYQHAYVYAEMLKRREKKMAKTKRK
ncbi:MAG: hypothetical protein IJH18_00945 [Bacilli bacterium]|nr:hypothetical protein [Bacilli bacterium]